MATLQTQQIGRPHVKYLSNRSDFKRLRIGELVHGAGDLDLLVNNDSMISNGLIGFAYRTNKNIIRSVQIWEKDIELVPIASGTPLNLVRFDEMLAAHRKDYTEGDTSGLYNAWNARLPRREE